MPITTVAAATMIYGAALTTYGILSAIQESGFKIIHRNIRPRTGQRWIDNRGRAYIITYVFGDKYNGVSLSRTDRHHTLRWYEPWEKFMKRVEREHLRLDIG